MAGMKHPVRFGIQIPQQHGSWQEMLSLWQEVDALGFDSAWVFDHFLPIFSDPTGPCLEGWTALSALAMVTKQVQLGVMVTGNTYRHPAVLAKMATTVDIISGGRLILGIGAGWFELEHQTFGLTFPKVSERLKRLDETLEIVKRLWTEERVNFSGRYYQLKEALLNPRPVQRPHPPILVGASGEQVALGIVARRADMWNSFGSPEVFARKIAVLAEHCRRVGRDPDTIEKSVLLQLTLTDDQETKRKARENESGGRLVGSSDDVRQQIEHYVAVGVTHIVISVSAPYDRAVLHRFASEVMPAFR
ncbi:MAG: LLM class F420-dependent oxidoreductase [Deltaproteobacteria bacterium]|nr:LLM class F420-dependent oxidoreductase [Deltaproteobacteria bacterium]